MLKKKEGKEIPVQPYYRAVWLQEVKVPKFLDNRHFNVVRMSAQRTSRLYCPENIRGKHFCKRLSRPQDHSAAGRIMSKKNSNDTIGNRTRDLPACSAVHQPPCHRVTQLYCYQQMLHQKQLRSVKGVCHFSKCDSALKNSPSRDVAVW